jgi:hypothetical protein
MTRYRTDQYGSVYEYSAEHDAYLFIGKLNGRTVGEFFSDMNDLDDIQDYGSNYRRGDEEA